MEAQGGECPVWVRCMAVVALHFQLLSAIVAEVWKVGAVYAMVRAAQFLCALVKVLPICVHVSGWFHYWMMFSSVAWIIVSS